MLHGRSVLWVLSVVLLGLNGGPSQSSQSSVALLKCRFLLLNLFSVTLSPKQCFQLQEQFGSWLQLAWVPQRPAIQRPGPSTETTTGTRCYLGANAETSTGKDGFRYDTKLVPPHLLKF